MIHTRMMNQRTKFSIMVLAKEEIMVKEEVVLVLAATMAAMVTWEWEEMETKMLEVVVVKTAVVEVAYLIIVIFGTLPYLSGQ